MELKQVYELDLKIENLYFFQRIMVVVLFMIIIITFDMGNFTWILFVLFFGIWFYYRGIFLKKVKNKTKVYLYNNFILLKTPFYKKEISYSDIKNICYIESKSNIGDFIINITPIILDYKYLLLMKNFYDSKNYIEVISLKNESKISFFEGASYNLQLNKLKLSKQIGFIIQYRRTKIPSLKIR